jgi:hypothetical protein
VLDPLEVFSEAHLPAVVIVPHVKNMGAIAPQCMHPALSQLKKFYSAKER